MNMIRQSIRAINLLYNHYQLKNLTNFIHSPTDGSGMNNGSDHVTGASAPAQKYVTFDDDIPSTRTYDNSQPFTGMCISLFHLFLYDICYSLYLIS